MSALPSPITQYAYAPGTNVALGSLRNVESHLYAQNYWRAGDARYRPVVRSQPVDLYPIREQSLDQYESGDGAVFHFWMLTLKANALAFYLNDLYGYPSAPVTSVAVTINTRQYDADTYTRYNAYAYLPTFAESGGDIQQLRQGVFVVRQRFGGLELAS